MLRESGGGQVILILLFNVRQVVETIEPLTARNPPIHLRVLADEHQESVMFAFFVLFLLFMLFRKKVEKA